MDYRIFESENSFRQEGPLPDKAKAFTKKLMALCARYDVRLGGGQAAILFDGDDPITQGVRVGIISGQGAALSWGPHLYEIGQLNT